MRVGASGGQGQREPDRQIDQDVNPISIELRRRLRRVHRGGFQQPAARSPGPASCQLPSEVAREAPALSSSPRSTGQCPRLSMRAYRHASAQCRARKTCARRCGDSHSLLFPPPSTTSAALPHTRKHTAPSSSNARADARAVVRQEGVATGCQRRGVGSGDQPLAAAAGVAPRQPSLLPCAHGWGGRGGGGGRGEGAEAAGRHPAMATRASRRSGRWPGAESPKTGGRRIYRRFWRGRGPR